jgi:hypothetical protein
MPIKINKNFTTLKIKLPSTKQFWQSVWIETVSVIRENTERGVDADGKQFKQYSKQYKKQKGKSGRSTRVNLLWSGQMLSAMGRGVRATTHGVKIILSGEQGFKAWQNEKQGREFFAISKRNSDKTLRKVKRWIDRHN